MEKKDLLIIIPAYNEKDNIEKVLSQLETPEIAKIADVLVMNDASSDETNLIVKRRKHTLVTHVFNLGYGSALQLGYKYAIRRNYNYVIQMDADGQHDICNVISIYNKLKSVDENNQSPDIVLGSRFIEGSKGFPVSKCKKIAVEFFRWMIRKFTGKKIMDPTTGLQGLSRRTVLFYSKYNNFDDKYPDANMIIQMILLGYRIEEIPAVMHERKSGVSMHSGWKPFLYMFRMTLSILVIVVRHKLGKLTEREQLQDEFVSPQPVAFSGD